MSFNAPIPGLKYISTHFVTKKVEKYFWPPLAHCGLHGVLTPVKLALSHHPSASVVALVADIHRAAMMIGLNSEATPRQILGQPHYSGEKKSFDIVPGPFQVGRPPNTPIGFSQSTRQPAPPAVCEPKANRVPAMVERSATPQERPRGGPPQCRSGNVVEADIFAEIVREISRDAKISRRIRPAADPRRNT